MTSPAFGRPLQGIAACALLTGLSAAQSPSTVRVSVDSSGAQADHNSYFGAISGNGRYVVFQSYASNLVPGDTNGAPDIFVRDLHAGTTERVSVSSSGAQSDGDSFNWPSISADGRFVAFGSNATNLVPGDTNGFADVFVRDRLSGTTERVSIGPNGTQEAGPSVGTSISADGRYVLFACLPPPMTLWQLRIRDRQVGTTEVLYPTQSPIFQGTDAPRLSADGRFVAYDSIGTQVSVYDRQTATTEIVSIAGGSPVNGICVLGDITPDGRYVAFWSTSSNLVPGDTNGYADTFLRDRQTSGTTRVSLSSSGTEGNYDSGYGCAISADGRYVVFQSSASNLVSGDNNGHPGQPWTGNDVFLRDRLAGTTTMLSVDTNGIQGNSDSAGGAISADGRFVAFESAASNLVSGDTNGSFDIFLRDRGIPMPYTYCTAKVNSLGCTPAIGYSGLPSISGPDNFHVTASNVLNNRKGMMIWSGAAASTPFHGGTLCIAPPIIPTRLQNSGGNLPPLDDCSGAYSFHFTHEYMTEHFLGVGSEVFAEYWSRDPGFTWTSNDGLTDGMHFVIGP